MTNRALVKFAFIHYGCTDFYQGYTRHSVEEDTVEMRRKSIIPTCLSLHEPSEA